MRDTKMKNVRAIRRICFRVVSMLLAAVLACSSVTQTTREVRPQPRSAPLAQGNLQERTFHSASLGRDSRYYALLPVDYARSQKRYPVLYLLHGWHGDYTNWIKLTKLVEYARRYSLIIITPDAKDSWYVNSGILPQDRFEDLVVKDLIQEVDSHWRTVRSADSRAIAGLSMGGYGAVLLALKHTGLFALAGSVSGAFDGPNGIERILPQLQQSVEQAYGEAGSRTRGENDIYNLARISDIQKVPYLFLDCGSQDPLLPSNRKLVEILSTHKITYEYHEYEGAHTWAYWDHSLPMLLAVTAKKLSSEQVRRKKRSVSWPRSSTCVARDSFLCGRGPI